MPHVEQPTILFLQRWNDAEGPRDFSLHSYRNTIADLVHNFLTDLDDVEKSLATHGEAVGSLRSLTMCLEFLKENGEIFHYDPGDCHIGQTQGQIEEKKSQAFCSWFIRHLLRLLSHPGCVSLHSISIRLLTHLLHSVKYRNRSVFSYQAHLLELIHTCGELVSLSDHLFDGGDTVNLSHFDFDIDKAQQSLRDPASSSAAQDDQLYEHKIQKVEVTLDNPHHCELLQVNIVKILQGMLIDVCQLVSTRVDIVWGCLCWGVHNGDIDLKMASLECLSKLIVIQGMPTLPVSEYFLQCFTAMWEFLCTLDNPLDAGQQLQLETATSALTMALIEKDKYGYLASKQRFFRQFTQSVCYLNFTNSLGLGAKQSVVSFFIHIIKGIPMPDLTDQLNGPSIEILLQHLLDNIGADQSSEFMIPLLVELVLIDSPPVLGSQVSDTSSEDSFLNVHLSARKRKRSDSEPVKIVEFPVFNRLSDKMMEIMTDKCPSAKELECLLVVIEVGARCLLRLCTPSSGMSGRGFPFMKELTLNMALDSWTRYFKSVAEDKAMQSSFSDRYSIILQTTAAILITQDVHPRPMSVLQELSWMITLPWIANDFSWKDMKPSKPKDVTSIAAKLVDKFDEETIRKCLQVMCLLPRETSVSWRSHVIIQAIMDRRVEVVKTAVRCFPVLLHQLGSRSNFLIQQLIVPLVLSTNPLVAGEVAKSFGSLCLAQAGAAKLSKPPDSDFRLRYDQLHVERNYSEYSNKGGKTANGVKRSVKLPDILPFLDLLKHAQSHVRKDALASLAVVFPLVENSASDQMKKALSLCLKALDDDSLDVRMQCSQLIPYLVSPDAKLGKQCATDQHVLSELETVCLTAHGESNRPVLHTALAALGQFGRVVDGEALQSVIVRLLELRLSRQRLTSATAFTELVNIAAYKRESLQQIYSRFKCAICKFLVEEMYMDQVNTGGTSANNILLNTAETLGVDLKAFLQGGEKFMLPFLVSKASPEATKVLKMIASMQLSTNIRKSLLINNTKYIFSYLVCHCQPAEMEKALTYLQAETDFSLGNLLRLDFQRVHNELLLHLSTHYQQVFGGLKTLATYDEQYKGPRDISSTEEMAVYLEPRLLGVLAFFDSQLMNSNVTPADKELTLKSMISIIQLMGSKHISTIRHKVMNTLRLGLQFTEKPFTEISCKAWNCFVRSLELPLLGVMMSQIIAALLPLLQALPDQVAQIINYIIIENRAILSKHFPEVYFLPDLPELSDAKQVLAQYGEGTTSTKELRVVLCHSIQGIHHESLEVRQHALSKLRKILIERRAEIKNCVLNSEPVEPVIPQLISALVNGCRETDPKTQILYGQCLGELGAIDPGRLELISNTPNLKPQSFHGSVEEDNFAFNLINLLVKAYLAATEPRVQDCAAFALQELLQIYSISGQGEGQGAKTTSKLWKMFPEQTQEILLPLLSSKYRLTIDSVYCNYPKPLYGSDKGKNFKDWVSSWTGYLIAKVKPGKACRVFTACSATNRHNVEVALQILPHVILHVLQDGTEEDVNEIFEELMEVLRYVQRPETRNSSASDFHHLSAQTIFSILDYLTMWCNHRVQTLTSTTLSSSKGAVYDKDPAYVAIKKFMARIPQELFAQACYNCKAYTRALRHFEMFLGTTDSIQPHLDFMQRLYVSMDEPDGVLGVASVRISQPSIMQQIMMYESLGQQQDAQACCEKGIQVEPNEISHYHCLLRNLIDLTQPHNALVHTAGILAERPHWRGQLNNYCIEAALKLGSWDKLDEALKHEHTTSRTWPVLMGRILKAAKERQESDFLEQLDFARREQMGPLSAASMEIGSYHRGYENILRLHMICEIEEFFSVMNSFPQSAKKQLDTVPTTATLTEFFSQWQTRIQMAQSSFRTQEPILTLRRTLLSLVQNEGHPALKEHIGKLWLWSAKVARKAGYLQSAYGCLIQANSYSLPEFYVEKAKWLRAKGEPEAAISCLEKGINEHFNSITQAGRTGELNSQMKDVYAQSLLLYGKYSEEASNLETNAIMKQYKEVIEICPEWEEGYFHLAKYYDRIMNAIIDDRDKVEKQGEFIIHVVRNFGESLKYGNQHIYQSMPRILSLWFNYGTALVEAERTEKSKSAHKVQVQRSVLGRINQNIQLLSQQLAPYQLFTAFPQLISRICHAQPEVFQHLMEIIANLLLRYPQQAMWNMMAVSKSSYQMRVKRCQEIFSAAMSKDSKLAKFIQDSRKLTEKLLELCEKDFGGHLSGSLSQNFKPLKRLLEDKNFSQILLPLQSAVNVNLPNSVKDDKNHNPFPDAQIYIQGVDDTIEVLPSLQRPKKITMIGSDGQRYTMMCKPKDDLRKDCRLMEFNTIINRFLRRDAESRKRRLLIRTYAVTPLNEECGLIEWVNNTTGLRHILVKLHKEKGCYMSGKELKAVMPALNSSLETKMNIYKNKLLARCPVMLPEWFMRTFPDPTSWYSARVSYARTAAVMSIVGYILGLGDRHGENILFDSKTGDCVHVDFNCLFNKGETFEWPERVPFRLTHNMVAALGPLGHEGLFRKSCELTLGVIRDQMEPLMSVLKPFIYDPLVEWSKPGRGHKSNDTGEINNELALNHVQNIEDRMRGILKTKFKPRCLPLSITGQVSYLIKEATDEKNLCQMYIGWAAHM